MRDLFAFAVAALLFLPAAVAGAVDVQDTRLLGQPAVSDTHIAFVYANDLWVANLDGSGVRRLTTHAGTESRPRFSPDGSLIAFSGGYDGNTDVFVVPVVGGVPQRLTWHPSFDIVQGFTSDGSAVLFASPRQVHTRRYTQLFTVPVTGGFPTRLPIPHAAKASYSPDGSRVAYQPLFGAFRQWKHYRGGTTSRIWLFDVNDYSVVQVPQPESRCNDTDPTWVGDQLFFISDRNGELNLFSFDEAAGEVTQLTNHQDFPIISASAGGGRVIYEQAGYLHLFDLEAGASIRLQIGIGADLSQTRPRYVSGEKYFRSGSISPSGKRAVLEVRGEIVTVPAEQGDPRYLTRTTGAHEREPAWSPSDDRIAYFSDKSGEYALHVAPQDGRGEVMVVPLDGSGFYSDLKWSPDSKKLSYTDNSWSLYILDLDSGQAEKISSETVYGPVKTLHHAWAPDSRWLAYTRNNDVYFQRVYLYSIEEKKSFPVTDGLSDVSEPVFDRDGKYLYFLASTNAGPARQWFAQSNNEIRLTHDIYLAVLSKDEANPLAKQSDEEEEVAEEAEEEADTDKNEKKKDKGKKGKDDKDDEDGESGVEVAVDFEGLDQRIVALPVDTGAITNLTPGPAGSIYYMKSETGFSLFGGMEWSLNKFDFEEREEKQLLGKVDGFAISADGKKLLVASNGGLQIADAGAEIEPGKGKLDLTAIKIRIDPRSEWQQIYNEAWRINRDYFYDPGMHGADWPAMRDKYAQLLPDLTTRDDLNLLIRWLCSELAVGHSGVFGGDQYQEPERVPGGLLGADYEIDQGRYRFAKVFGGLNWNPELRSPLTEPGVGVAEGDYLLAVDGHDLKPPENLFSRFENTAGKIVELTVATSPDGADSRTVKVVPVANEAALRNRDWVESNIAKVDQATDGRVAYVHVPDTAIRGYTYFKRYFFPQAHKQAIIIDERHNGGGMVADYYIDILRRPYISHWTMRYGNDIKTPLASIQGPKVMLIDETAGSGGDLLPWMFRKLELGTLIGRRTWGGLVGVLGFPVLMDGGRVSAPNLAFRTDQGWEVENIGVPPDIEVEQWPAEVIAGHDPQLEKAIEVILEQLEANPPEQHPRPPFPIRVRN
jgi:tricorn protease